MENPSTAPASIRPNARSLALWLLAVAALVLAIVAVGGITRLTESGVSITEWKPVTGTIPPLNDAQWEAEFAEYRQTPQWQQVNGPAGMTLETYKFIYFWEWVHRLLGRVIGLALVGVTAVFWLKGRIPPGYKPRLLALIGLVGLQGAIGWWMVTSGIATDVKVSHFRLAVHLLTALLTLGGLVWTALDLLALSRDPAARPARVTRFGGLVLAVLTIQLLLGAWVAGLRAGVVAGGGWFNWDAWPLMQGTFYPEGVDWAGGALWTVGHDPFLIHFLHRWWAWALVAVLIVLARRIRRLERRASVAIHSAFGLQILLGIATVWSGMEVWLAVLHQTVGALLVMATAWGVHVDGRRAQQRVEAGR
ncbi:heme A synthase [Altererythrobacter aerius]|uniref:Heme A synthase n=1 Tax=Tsuneonella aeria TaxID=1837929 RepID=A0A6I4TFJ2_9SPHN|nr:COX15/CtaA family protein [Tsuneonella aeria]MXO75397.1 heme A synthase [Tsuneonella aeria]